MHFFTQLVGSIMVAAFMEILIGASGMVSVLLRFIGPLTVAPTIMLMGLAVAETGFELAGKHWGISAAYVVFSSTLTDIYLAQYKIFDSVKSNHLLYFCIYSACIL